MIATPELTQRKMMNKTEPWSRELVEHKRRENLQKRQRREVETPAFEMRNTGATIQQETL